ncbi:Na+/melibiose symporter-like transporter [Methylopila capsulata]|uniref:MFS transporter n=1 Tax=Methylopila capsulata TaxID=61654 RepID=A0A9W6IYH2_9HYPH|nr:MFS transporter [Methylopila capsulata]MBM7853192.1 Na+/melibiose symporter-like transporter [Methylopila capsulata]GLK57594.1 MFS transporter [Methylopila capsulata]
MRTGRELSLAALVAYALPAIPFAALTLPLYIVVPSYYAEGLGLPLAAVGNALLAVRLIDAIADPAVGVVADRWRPRFGRRRLWFAAAMLPTAIASWMIFTPEHGDGIGYLLLWGAALSIAWTAALVPYNAWGAELSTSYAGRSRIAAWRESAALVGTLIALSLQAVIPAMTGGGQAEVLASYAVFVGLGLPLLALGTLTLTPEPVDASRRRLGFREGLAAMKANTAFARLLIAFFVNGFANGLPATLFLFFVGERLGAPDLAGPFLVAYFAAGVLGVPLWLWLARRTSKHRAWCLAMLLASAVFLLAPLLGPGDVVLFGVVCLITGAAVGADLALPPSIQADVIDVDTAASGEQRSGLYLAAWGLATKLALAAAVGLAFPVLAATGFDPAAGLREPLGLTTLAWLYGGLPVALKLLAVGLMWNFPLDEASQKELRARIEAAA